MDILNINYSVIHRRVNRGGGTASVRLPLSFIQRQMHCLSETHELSLKASFVSAMRRINIVNAREGAVQ
ncbi:hypothetical protein OKW30_007823 [Paraburkholderia sp. Clong3]